MENINQGQGNGKKIDFDFQKVPARSDLIVYDTIKLFPAARRQLNYDQEHISPQI